MDQRTASSLAGFSLIEVSVALATMAIVMTTLSSFNGHLFSRVRAVNDDIDRLAAGELALSLLVYDARMEGHHGCSTTNVRPIEKDSTTFEYASTDFTTATNISNRWQLSDSDINRGDWLFTDCKDTAIVALTPHHSGALSTSVTLQQRSGTLPDDAAYAHRLVRHQWDVRIVPGMNEVFSLYRKSAGTSQEVVRGISAIAVERREASTWIGVQLRWRNGTFHWLTTAVQKDTP